MTTLMSGLVNVFNHVVGMPKESVETPTSYQVGSLQEHLLSMSRPSIEAINSYNELTVGPPPLTTKYDAPSNVIAMPKRQGSRVIFWSKIDSSTEAA